MEIYIFLGFGIVLAIIIALIFIKDSETNKKFTRYERAIESAIQENYNLKKQLAALASFKPDDDEQLKDVKDELKEQINEQMTLQTSKKIGCLTLRSEQEISIKSPQASSTKKSRS